MRQQKALHWAFLVYNQKFCLSLWNNKITIIRIIRAMAAAIKASIGSPGELDITHWRNDSIDYFEITIYNRETNVVIDLSIYDEVLMQIKNDSEDSAAIISLSRASGSILWSVDSNGNETGSGTDGKIVLYTTSTQMEVVDAGKFVYDIQFTHSANTKRNTLVFGEFKVIADRTR